MLNFVPRSPRSLLEPLGEVCRVLDRTPVVRVEALSVPAALGEYLLTDADGAHHRLTTVFADRTGSGSSGVLIVARRHELDREVPVSGPLITLPVHILGCPAVLRPLPKGTPALQAPRPTALHAVGQVLHRLSRSSQLDPGTIATPHRFVSPHGDWGLDFRHLCTRWAEQARSGGTGLEPLMSELLARIDPGALAFEEPPVLVPGGLSLGTIWLAPDGALQEVDGWFPTWCGDPLSAWAPFLHLSADALATIIAAYDRPLDLEQRIERLSAYQAGHALMLMADAAAAIGPYERTAMLDRALLVAGAVSGLPERLRAATTSSPHPASPSRRCARVLALQDRLVREPVYTDRSNWLATAGAVLLAHHVGHRPETAGWNNVAEHALRHLETGGPAAVLDRRTTSAPVSSAPHAIVRWIGKELRAATGGHAPTGWLSQLDALGRFPDDAERTPHAQLLEAVLGLAACQRLGDEVEPQLADTLRIQADSAWTRLDYFAPPLATPLDHYLAYYSSLEAQKGNSSPIGLLLFAFLAGGALPLAVMPPSILRALGVRPP